MILYTQPVVVQEPGQFEGQIMHSVVLQPRSYRREDISFFLRLGGGMTTRFMGRPLLRIRRCMAKEKLSEIKGILKMVPSRFLWGLPWHGVLK